MGQGFNLESIVYLITGSFDALVARFVERAKEHPKRMYFLSRNRPLYPPSSLNVERRLTKGNMSAE